MTSFDFSQICKFSGAVLAFLILLKSSRQDVQTRSVANIFPISIAVVFALSSFGAWFFMAESMPLTSIATQVVFAVGIGLLLLVVTVGLEQLQHKELFGGGDIKIIAASTLFLSVETFMAAMLVACILFVLGAISKRRKFSSWTDVTLPFVPFWTTGFATAVALAYFL